MILRLDLRTEARNTAVQQAKAHARVTSEEDAASVGSDREAASDAEAAGVELAGYLPQDPDTVRERLLQSSLLADARKKGIQGYLMRSSTCLKWKQLEDRGLQFVENRFLLPVKQIGNRRNR